MRMFFRLTSVLLLAICAPAQSAPLPKFEDIAQTAGLTVSHISSPEKRYIVESMSGGAGMIDCDNDGKLDIITVNGSTIDRFKQGGDPMVTLYHQDDGLKFTERHEVCWAYPQGLGNGRCRGRLRQRRLA